MRSTPVTAHTLVCLWSSLTQIDMHTQSRTHACMHAWSHTYALAFTVADTHHTRTHRHAHMQTQWHTRTCTHTLTHTHLHTQTHTHAQSYTHARKWTHVHTCTLNLPHQTSTQTHMCYCTERFLQEAAANAKQSEVSACRPYRAVSLCIWVCFHACECMLLRTSVFACMWVHAVYECFCTHASACWCVRVCLHACKCMLLCTSVSARMWVHVVAYECISTHVSACCCVRGLFTPMNTTTCTHKGANTLMTHTWVPCFFFLSF
jgi:hypothetical protein